MKARNGFWNALWFALIFFFATFVWPTRYRHDHIGANPIREDRFTGQIDFCTLQGWTPQLPAMR